MLSNTCLFKILIGELPEEFLRLCTSNTNSEDSNSNMIDPDSQSTILNKENFIL